MPRVLVIEDHPDNRVVLRRVLQRTGGWDMVEAEDGETGVELAKTCDADLILLDYRLPGMNGDEVLKRLRADAATRSTPVWVLTAGAGDQLEDRLMRLGATGYLTKPLDFTALRGVLASFTG